MNGQQKTAVEVCRERLADISALMDQIGQELDSRYKPLEEADVNWSDASDLGRVWEDLVQTLQNISFLSKSDIEATLAELRG